MEQSKPIVKTILKRNKNILTIYHATFTPGDLNMPQYIQYKTRPAYHHTTENSPGTVEQIVSQKVFEM